MSERVEARSGVPIVARTFHAIAYDIIGIVEGSKPALADHATDDMAFHAEHNTTLIETYSYERQEGRLLTGLAEKVAPHVTLKPRPVDTIYDRIVELKQVDDFSKLIGTFLRKFKGGSYNLVPCVTGFDCVEIF